MLYGRTFAHHANIILCIEVVEDLSAALKINKLLVYL